MYLLIKAIPNHFLLPVLFAFLGALAIWFAKERMAYYKYGKCIWWALMTSLFIYMMIMITVIYTELSLAKELAQYDLNNNGVFSRNEITPEQQIAMKRVIGDTGRKLAPFTGVFISIALGLIIGWACPFERRIKIKKVN